MYRSRDLQSTPISCLRGDHNGCHHGRWVSDFGYGNKLATWATCSTWLWSVPVTDLTWGCTCEISGLFFGLVQSGSAAYNTLAVILGIPMVSPLVFQPAHVISVPLWDIEKKQQGFFSMLARKTPEKRENLEIWGVKYHRWNHPRNTCCHLFENGWWLLAGKLMKIVPYEIYFRSSQDTLFNE